MNIREAIKARHSVRQFRDLPVGEAEAARLREIIKAIPHNPCASDTQSDFSSECINLTQAGERRPIRFSPGKENLCAMTENMQADDVQRRKPRVVRCCLKECNAESGLNIQLIENDPECFSTMLAHYGKFKNAVNYIAAVGKKSLPDLDERVGYYGQRIVLEAQMQGLNTCWVAGTYGKGKCKADTAAGEKIVCVIAVGYGETEGVPHKSKPLAKLCALNKEDMPVWFKNGMLAAVLAPTALNQQRFFIDIDGEDAVITARRFPLAKIDLGIVRYNFEAASGHKCRPK